MSHTYAVCFYSNSTEIGHTSVIKLLLGTNTATQDSRKVDLAAKDNAGKTALDYASINSKEDIVLLLQDSIGEA